MNLHLGKMLSVSHKGHAGVQWHLGKNICRSLKPVREYSGVSYSPTTMNVDNVWNKDMSEKTFTLY